LKNAFIAAENLGLKIADRWLFRNLNFEVKSGDFVSITGISGSGKSSLLKVLTGEKAATEGTVRCQKEMTEIPQDLALNDQLTVLQNALVCCYKRKSIWSYLIKDQSKVSEAKLLLKRWGIMDAEQKVSQLSGGEKQRVALVRSLLDKWELILADEPISQLDELNARNCLDTLRAEAKKRNGAVLVVLHDARMVEEYSTRVIDIGADPDLATLMDKRSTEKISSQ
jgi:ABC-type phosphate/phosphonate transport system ATPase subunit